MHSDGSAEIEKEKVISECLYMVGLNFLGIYYRFTREIVMRITFIDKRECVEENFLLLAAKGQEKMLLMSMIPEQIAEKMEADIQMRLLHLNDFNRRKRPSETFMYRKLFVETHDDVTILYADIVNFVYLSTTLNVKTLVGTLHDIYVRFDDAALALNVLRIQFLGDCYYCVANVSTANMDHAMSCVKLGLRMIKDIKQVGNERSLQLSMRIGVHSGSVLSGVVGTNKWQFDIYSSDVDIAGRLERTGVPGRVHISDRTFAKLDKVFPYENGPEKAQGDPLLQKYHIKTFLILSLEVEFPDLKKVSSHTFSHQEFPEIGVKGVYSAEVLHNLVEEEMIIESTTIPLETTEIRRIFIGKSKNLTRFEKIEKNFDMNFSWLFVCFKSWRWEHNYMIQPDTHFKRSVLFSFVIIILTISMQAINARQNTRFWVFAVFGITALSFLLVVVWYRRIWDFHNTKWYQKKPRNKVSRWFFMHSDFAECSLYFRIFIYFTIIVLHLSYTLSQLLDCQRFKVENEQIEIILLDDSISNNLCFNPWAVTQCVLFNMIIIFLFSRIIYLLKLIIGLTVVICYLIIILVTHDFIYERSPTCNNKLYPEYAHVFVVCVTLIVLNMLARQLEFINRVGYYWKRELNKNQYDVKFVNNTITRLISNILPSHIVDIYMEHQLSDELYYEEYTNVAVMFATILNYDITTVGMRLLNEIICDFDEVLNTFRGVNKVEKIKIAGWTYMAACGLNTTGTGHRGSTTKTSSSFSLSEKWRKRKLMTKLKRMSEKVVEFTTYSPRASTAGSSKRRSVRMLNDEEEPTLDDDVVYVMARFALELLRTMKQFNNQNIYSDGENIINGALRIGIANGPVMAGVVGLFKPHYDIWGNVVNMASRMDSTGVAGSIQITEEAATALEYRKVQCTYRGVTFVKGRGDTPTYFIDIDDQLNFKKLPQSETDNSM
ncbi:adenylyl cyclase X E-like [Eurosta solidaginis]|uniref:adenylyl cyclase X E-like n=1 Tax=Eurosta solidaginis TaxID=178769 RepID=UPI0035315F20